MIYTNDGLGKPLLVLSQPVVFLCRRHKYLMPEA